MLRDMLNLKSAVTVNRITETSDGMGGTTSSTTSTILTLAAIYGSGSSNRWLSDRINRDSTHMLICEPSAYSWGQDDRTVTYNGATYKIIGRPENVMQLNEVLTLPLELIT